MKNKYYYEFIFEYMAFDGHIISEFLNLIITTFRPKSLLGEKYEFSKESLQEIELLEFKYKSLSIKGDEGTHFNVSPCIQNNIEPRGFFQVVRFFNKTKMLSEEEINFFLKISGFKIGIMCSNEYNFFQSTDNPSIYLANNLKYSHLALYFNEIIQDERIDISKNPGRERFLPGMKFIPAYKIWFGKESQELFGKEKILSYSKSIFSKELENGIIEMQLMDDITKCDSKENQEKQRDIVQYLGIDKMEVSKY